MSLRSNQSGMTLLEVLIAMAILAGMMLLTWRSFQTTAEAKIETEQIQDREHEIRVAVQRIVTDLEGAYLSANEDQSLDMRRTLFIGKDASPVDDLRFSSMTHVVLWSDAAESEQTLLNYFAEADPEDSTKINLMRRESRRLSNENWIDEPAEVDVLLRDVLKVQFEYYDWRNKEWKRHWNSTQADAERSRLPFYVRIHIELPGPGQGSKKNRVILTTARPMMQEELRFFVQ